jgi:hypothetical protein
MSMRRRDFLGAVGVSAGLAPFVPYFNRRAEAQGFARRFLVVFTGCGTLDSEFYPQGGEADFTFKPGSIAEPLAKHRNKLIYPRGMRRLTSGSGAHEKNMGGALTGSGLVATNGYPRSASIDQLIAQQLNAPTAFKSLQFGVQCDSFNPGGNKPVLKSMTYSGSNAVLRPEDDPGVMFNKLMLNNAPKPPTGGQVMGPSTEEIARLRARKQSVLDAVRGDLKALSVKIDREDRVKLEQHLEGIAGIEKRLQQPINPSMPGSGACGAPMVTGAGGFSDATARANNTNFPMILDIQNKLAVAALACDRTRVATLQWSRAFSGVRHEWVGVREDHHTISHRTGANDIAMLHKINRWYAERFAELLSAMDAIPEGSGTLLDNTAVIWVNEANTGNHAANTMPSVIAGSLGGKLKTGPTGRLVQLAGYDWSQVLITMAHGMGVTGINKLGDLGMKDGPIPGLMT